MKNILTYGLMPAGQSAGEQVISVANGNVLGKGVYTSKLPLYAQLYATCEQWKGKYVQTLVMIRQDPKSVSQHGTEGCYTTTMIGRSDIHKLYGGLIGEEEVQFFTQQFGSTVIRNLALLVKIHEVSPNSKEGEYYQIASLLQELSPQTY